MKVLRFRVSHWAQCRIAFVSILRGEREIEAAKPWPSCRCCCWEVEVEVEAEVEVEVQGGNRFNWAAALLMHMRDSIKSAPRRKTVDKQTVCTRRYLPTWRQPFQPDELLRRSQSRSQQLGNVCKWLDGVCGVLLTFRGMEKIKLKCKLDSRLVSCCLAHFPTLSLSPALFSLCLGLCVRLYIGLMERLPPNGNRLPTVTNCCKQKCCRWLRIRPVGRAARCQCHLQEGLAVGLARPLGFTYLCSK